MEAKDEMMKMFGPRHETSLAFIFTLLVLPCSAALYGCGASADDDAIPRPDVVVIDGLSRLGELERPAVEFPHDQHTQALAEQDKDCETCHLRMDNERLSQRFLRLVDENRDAVMDIYHEKCIACHNETAAAGSKSGPIICGDCHRRRPLYVSTRTPMGFDRSLHHRHVEGVGYECGECHHEFNEETKALFYAKGEESTCRYCHESATESVVTRVESSWESPTLGDAAHWACLDCHSVMPNAGPVACSGCHSPEAQKKIAKVEDPKRLERGQPDFVLLYASSNELDQTKLNTVPFSHVGHEDFHETCRTCHHADMNPCVQCHTLHGNEEGGGVPLQRAMHDMSSEHSCVGCHDGHKEDPACSGCHAQIEQGTLSEHACTICHAGPSPLEVLAVKDRYTSLLDFTPPPEETRLSFNEEDIPETVVIGTLAEQYNPAEMPHRKIVGKLMEHIGESRIATRFHGHEDVVCQGCHHHSPAGRKPPLCENCHGEPFNSAALHRPGLFGAFHQQCIGCHQSMEIEPSSQDCEGCHTLRPTVTSSLDNRSNP